MSDDVRQVLKLLLLKVLQGFAIGVGVVILLELMCPRGHG